MKAHLTLFFALLLICTGAALAQGTPDWETPSQETICDGETGAAYGLCNAYCEAMDCESAAPHASATACAKVKDKFTQITGRDLPCNLACPCQAIPEFNAVLEGEVLECYFYIGNSLDVITTAGLVAATQFQNLPGGGGCARFQPTPPIALDLTPEQGAACVDYLATFCTPE